MPLELHPITSEADIVTFAQIMLSAFESGGGITAILTPSPIPDDYLEKAAKRHIKSWREESDVAYLKVIDTDLGGKMIAAAKWRINEKERTWEAVEKTLPVSTSIANPWKRSEFVIRYRVRTKKVVREPRISCGSLTASGKTIWARSLSLVFLSPVYTQMRTNEDTVLNVLATDPEHHRRGAGTMLLSWGLRKADSAQLPSFLESSPMGKPLYARLGFKPVEVVHWDLTKYGYEGSDYSTVMLRDPLPLVL
jgi:GNAT superfamily N-acetyltransferase